MAPRFRRRRRDRWEQPHEKSTELDSERLDGEAHAWWAQRDLDAAWTPRKKREPTTAEERQDPLAEAFGADWRTSFDFSFEPVAAPVPQPAPAPEPSPEPVEPPDPPPPDADPYELLGLTPTASWDDIVAAHRSMVREHHPDRVAGGSPEQQAAAEDWIRAVNAAYQELKVRRAR